MRKNLFILIVLLCVFVQVSISSATSILYEVSGELSYISVSCATESRELTGTMYIDDAKYEYWGDVMPGASYHIDSFDINVYGSPDTWYFGGVGGPNCKIAAAPGGEECPGGYYRNPAYLFRLDPNVESEDRPVWYGMDEGGTITMTWYDKSGDPINDIREFGLPYDDMNTLPSMFVLENFPMYVDFSVWPDWPTPMGDSASLDMTIRVAVITPVPEPISMVLFVIGLAGLTGFRMRFGNIK